jgi:hypothetical protein
MAKAVAEAKGQSFDLYKQQLSQEEQLRAEEKAKRKAFRDSIKMAVITAAATAVGGAALKGFTAGAAGAGPNAGFFDRLKAGGAGIYSGGSIGEQNVGGLKNLFSGNYAMSQIGTQKELIKFVSENPNSKITSQILSNLNTNGALKPNIIQSGVSNRSEFNNPYFEQRGDTIPNIPLGRATGGSIPSMSGIDTVPAMLSGGEFIMNAGATQRIGAGNLNAMNSGATSSNTDSKDLNDKLLAKLDELITASKEGGKSVTVNVASNGKEDTKAEGASEQDKNLSRKIKAAVVRVLEEEKRLGGVLRRN